MAPMENVLVADMFITAAIWKNASQLNAGIATSQELSHPVDDRLLCERSDRLSLAARQPRRPTTSWAALGGMLLGGQVRGGEPSPLLSTGVLCPVLGSSGQKGDGHTGEGPTKGHQDDEGIGASLIQGEAVRVGTVQTREV
ncbi:hypothetical protein QYF61_026995 [Mycteria americana]|uniref:Uncharacterized protein n=1 Tax=Mycteria americana TaxID=33587 RepID=A0AAN7RUQ2_MYCAM|nr:hypothetical protein QYF61_026995 [Mycteria americana]